MNFVIYSIQPKTFHQNPSYRLDMKYVMIMKYKDLMPFMGFIRTPLNSLRLQSTVCMIQVWLFIPVSSLTMWISGGSIKANVSIVILHCSVFKYKWTNILSFFFFFSFSLVDFQFKHEIQGSCRGLQTSNNTATFAFFTFLSSYHLFPCTNIQLFRFSRLHMQRPYRNWKWKNYEKEYARTPFFFFFLFVQFFGQRSRNSSG